MSHLSEPDADRMLDEGDEGTEPVYPHDCDEHCSGCTFCYQATSEWHCDQLCEHAEAF